MEQGATLPNKPVAPALSISGDGAPITSTTPSNVSLRGGKMRKAHFDEDEEEDEEDKEVALGAFRDPAPMVPMKQGYRDYADDDYDDDDEVVASNKVDMLMRVLESRMSYDHLHVGSKSSVISLLQHYENGSVDIRFSDSVTKFNRKGKAQTRFVVITSNAIYNIMPNSNFKSIRRRIMVDKISSVTLADGSDDFVAHVRGEYDYWFRSVRRGEIVRILARAYSVACGRDLPAEISGTRNLASTMVTKASISKQSISSNVAAADELAPAAKGGGKITKKIRSLVSKKKIRYQSADFDLDLTYITDRLIAMGFPSEDIEGIYRNPMSEVLRFLETKHPSSYKVYNLCSERTYDPSKFHRRVALFPFDDHNVPTIELILEFCRNVSEWLRHPDHVAAVHCKAGKGRTGLMMACYMLYAQMFSTADQALEYFGRKRTQNGKGVTIPSQRRFVGYFASFLRTYYGPDKPFLFVGVPLVLTNVHFTSTPHFDADGGCDPYFKVFGPDSYKLYDSRKVQKTAHTRHDAACVDLPCAARVRGNIKLIFYDQDQYSFDQPMFHLWLHTSFIEHNYVLLTKAELDKACKDTVHKRFDQGFAVELFFRPDDIATVSGDVSVALLSSIDVEKDLDRDASGSNSNVELERLRQKVGDIEAGLHDAMNQNSLLSMQVEDLREENDQLQQENASLRNDLNRALSS